MLRISISRFYRDRGVFDHLRTAVLPELAAKARQRDEQRIGVWSAGCASGEEPYTVAIIWARHVQRAFPEIGLQLVATDADEHMLQRARRATYSANSLKGAPADWLDAAFVRSDHEYVLRQDFREQVDFRQQDILRSMIQSWPGHRSSTSSSGILHSWAWAVLTGLGIDRQMPLRIQHRQALARQRRRPQRARLFDAVFRTPQVEAVQNSGLVTGNQWLFAPPHAVQHLRHLSRSTTHQFARHWQLDSTQLLIDRRH